MGSNVSLRSATPADIDTVFGLVKALAEYENLSHAVTGNADLLKDHLFGARPFAEVILAEVASKAAGFALFFITIQHSLPDQEFTWKTCLSCLITVAWELPQACSPTWQNGQSLRAVDDLNGAYWTGMNPRSPSISEWALTFCQTGVFVV